MTISYTISEDDYLQHQLFGASKSPRIKQQRRRSWILVTLALLAIGLFFYQNGNKVMTYYFIGIAILALAVYPFYQRSHYRKHYQRYIAETYKGRFGEISTLTFKDTHIETFDKTGESKINLSEVGDILETGQHIYLRMKTGGSLIIPKQKIELIDQLRNELQQLAGRLGIAYQQELDWKWR